MHTTFFFLIFFKGPILTIQAHGPKCTAQVLGRPNPLLLVLLAPGAWSKRVVPILLMTNGCVLSIMCNKPIRVSSPILFKNQLRLRHGRFAIYMAEVEKLNASLAWKRICSCVRLKRVSRPSTRQAGFHQSIFHLYAHNNNLLQ